MMKLINWGILLGLISCKPDNSTVTLNTLNYPGSIVFCLYDSETGKTDTGYIQNNELLVNINNLQLTRLSLMTDLKKREDYERISLWKEKGSVEIKAGKGNLINAEVIGSETTIIVGRRALDEIFDNTCAG